MVVIPVGSFMMGSPIGRKGVGIDQKPVHRVTISKPFAVGKFEVTFNEWDACVNDGGCGGYRPNDEGWGCDNRPVINVSWEDAKKYTQWLSRKTGSTYRLLSEAEWEYVARAGSTTEFNTGDRINPDQANFAGSSTYNGSRKGPYLEKTVPVGQYQPNAFGLFDIHGNVWEWTEDCEHNGYNGAPTNGSARTVGGHCSSRIYRGGSWGNSPFFLRSAFRTSFPTSKRIKYNGFRITKTLD